MTVTFNAATPFVDVRSAEYSGLDPVSPFDVGSLGGGHRHVPAAAPPRPPRQRADFGAGTTSGAFTGGGTGFTTRIITSPDVDIVEDRIVTTVGTYSATAR